MFGNKMKIFLITLCFMLSVSAVGAASDVGNVVSFDDDVETGDLDVDPPSGIDDINNVTYSKSEDTREPVIYGEDLSMYYKNGSRYEVSIYQDGKLINSQNNDSKVIFNVNGVNYTKELVNGKASIGINLNPGNYTITTFYHYTDGLATKTNNIEVLSTILANDVVKFLGMVLSIVLSFWMVVAVLWLMPVLFLILMVFFIKSRLMIMVWPD